MALLAFIWISFGTTEGIDILCNPNKCPEMKKGSGVCDIECMSPYCNFDAYILLNIDLKPTSDCFSHRPSYCTQYVLGNGICDEECNYSSLGYDLGDCSYCGPSCNKTQLGGTCDEGCNNPECYYDMGACRECSSGCNLSIWGNGVCNEACNNVDCNFDMGDCIKSTCAYNCNLWMIGNSICDEACYVEECEYDKTDCTCAPFCWDELLKNGVCDEACDTLSCKFDNWDCGYCNSGCTMRMLANDICDPECNTKECEWDYYACGCAEGCSVDDYGKCKPECLVGTCNYDRMSKDTNKWCNDKDLVLFTVYQQMLLNDTSYVVDVQKCFSASNYKCNLTMALDQSECHPECFIPECNYGLCSTNSYLDCKLSLPKSAWNLCELCTSSSEALGAAPCNQCFDTNIYCTYLNLFGRNIYYSNYLSTYEKFPHLSFYYVTSIEKRSSPPGNGTIDFPYETITNGLFSIRTDNNVIFLRNDGVHIWHSYDQSFGDFITSYLKITSQDGSIVTVKMNIWDWDKWIVSEFVEIENIIFDGEASMEVWELNQFALDALYDSKHDPSLFLRNVTFKNYPLLYSIIGGSGKLRLFNVNFDNIRLGASEGSAIISLAYDKDEAKESEFIYIGGCVTRLNNGFEFGDTIDFRGFLYAYNITKVLIKNVEFKYNLVYRKQGSKLNQASLIYASSVSFLEINNCTFMFNYLESGVIKANSNIGYIGDLNETYHFSYLYKDHVWVHDSKFISNYANSSLIDIKFTYNLLNVHLENLTFEANGIESGPAVLISNPTMLDEYKTGVIKPYKLYSGMNVRAVINQRWCKMDNLTFINNHGIGLISLTKMVHASLKNLKMESNGSPNEGKDLNSLLFDYFISNPDLYIKKQKKNAKALDCEYLVSISSSYNIDISPADIKNNTCRNSSPTYMIVDSDTANISSFNCLLNNGNGVLPTCILFSGNFDRVLENSLFDGNSNNYPTGTGAIEIKDGSDLYLNDCIFKGNVGEYGAAVYLAGYEIIVEDSLFDSNISPSGSGGALFFIQTLESEESLLAISASNFSSNSAYYGGSIYIAQKWAGASSTEILVESSTFKLNSAFYGSVLYVANTVSLVSSSAISSSNFTENSALVSGAISLFYSNGSLTIDKCDFLANSGHLSSVLHVDIANSIITINSSKFASNKGLSVILGNNQNIFSYLETKNCIFEYNYGSAISLNFDSFHDIESVFRHNSATFGSCLKLQNNATGISNKTYYFNNTGSTNGGAVFLSSNSQFDCRFCNFTNNYAVEGGALYAEQDSQFIVLDSIFSQNSCRDEGSAIHIFNSNKKSAIRSTKIYENKSGKGGSIVLINSKLFLHSSEVYKNNGGIKSTISYIEIYESEFWNQWCFQGCFINLLTDSSVYINNSIFSNGSASDSGGAIYSSSSSIIIELSEFKQISSAKAGGLLYSWFDNSVIIKSSKVFESNSLDIGGIIYAFQTPIIITNSVFDEFSSTGMYGNNLNGFDVSHSTFINGKGDFGGGIFCYSCSDIKINFCLFQNNTASADGGALYFDSNVEISQTKKYEIFMSSFCGNSASNGGAIYVNGVGISLSMTIFAENKALALESFRNSAITKGIGGAIKMSCTEISKCEFEISSCTFIRNSATYNGGAISWDDWKPKLLENNFTSNYAEYGNDYSSYPVKLMSINNNGTLEGYTNTRNLTDSPVSTFNLPSLAPGQDNNISIKVALVDSMDQIITTDNLSLGELKSKNLSTIITGVTKVKAVKGILTFSQYIISDEPGSNITIRAFSTAINNSKKPQTSNTVFDQNLLIKIYLRNCEIGEIKAGKNCEICGYGYYSLDPSKTQCLACSRNAECFGNYTMAPKAGYWRDNAYTDKFWRCPNPNACLGSPDPKNISYTGECNSGYKGNMCQSCKVGFSRSSNNKCKECPQFWSNVVITIAVTIALSIVAFIMITATRKSALKPKKLTSIYIKILLNYLQVTILTSAFKLNWPNEVLELFYIQSSADYVYQQLYSFRCLLKDEASTGLVYYRSLILISLLPAFMAFLILIIWTAIKLKKKSFKNFWDDYISACIVLLFLVHPHVVKKMFASFNCTEINYGEYWLEEDLDIRCWDSDHVFYIFSVSFPSIIIWGILLPTICLFALIKRRNHLKELNVRLRFGFLFNGYKLSHYYWEFILIYSKIILICCSVFLANIVISIQALIAAILLSLFFSFNILIILISSQA